MVSHKIGNRKKPLIKPYFTPKERGPINKRVAPSDSSKNFGLGSMSPKFFHRYCNGKGAQKWVHLGVIGEPNLTFSLVSSFIQ